ncbi:hypothetical protein [Virgisporangium aliadipatigenens]|uniref:hypothetical protein n=1 Tax=Virgisporangium aliadipatigenens TaxID=741659 RepID=UPI00194201C0|nr:hypothetical protein [Virgisporangium aliadipatigenens]
MNHGYRLAVDFGTSTTVAMLADPQGRVRPLLFDASPLLSSATGRSGRCSSWRSSARVSGERPRSTHAPGSSDGLANAAAVRAIRTAAGKRCARTPVTPW